MEKDFDKNYHNAMVAEYRKAKKIVPTIESEHLLIQKGKDGSRVAQNLLYNLNYPLLITYINPKNFWYYSGSIIELMNVAYDAVIPALKNFDFNIGGHFSNCFIPYAISKVRKFIAEDKIVYYPESAKKRGISITVSSLNELVPDCKDDTRIEKIDVLEDTNNIETGLQLQHMEEDIAKAIEKSDDKEDLKKILQCYNDSASENLTRPSHDLSKNYISRITGIHSEKIKKLRKKFSKFVRMKN